MMSFAAPASRNAACPCGSGLRYKECHGALATSAPTDALGDARALFERGELAAAKAASEALLRATPDDPLVLELCARCESAAGRPRAALALLLRAARALPAVSLRSANVYAIWAALGGAFADALRGRDDRSVESHRDAYHRWVAERAAGDRDQPIAVVLHVPRQADADAAAATLQSIAAQTRTPAEVIIVTHGRSAAIDRLRARAELLTCEVRFVDAPGDDKAESLEAGIAASRAPWIVVVEPPHAFAPRHLAELVGGVEAGGAQWGFADCTLVPDRDVATDVLRERQAALDIDHTALAKADSVGHAFIAASFPAVGEGAMVFSRRLHAAVGALRALPGHELWDFAVRATLEDEPVHVASATYRHAIVAGEATQSQLERERAQVAIFRDFYARACADRATGANPHAPTLARWGLAFLRRVFQTGHILMLDLDMLDRVHAYIERHEASTRLPALTPGINLVGFAFGEFGLGENMRAIARACQAAAVPFVVNDIDQRLQTRQADRTLAAHIGGDLRHALSLMCVNPDMLRSALPLLERTRAAGGRRVGYWYWELEQVPRTWDAAFDAVDELWCATEFIAAAIRRATAKPVTKIPPALAIAPRRPYRRAEFGLPDRAFLFLFTFDYNAFVARKNPAAVVRAFRAAFPSGRDDVGLVVKSVNGVHRPDRVAAIDALIGGDRRIHHLDRFLSRDESYGLIQACDAYVSLHRAEGLGLGLAEAMALGKPAVATGYSGNLEFMNEDNSLLVTHRIVPVAPDEYLHVEPGFAWADPDIDDAARQMRRLADDRTLRSRLAAAGPPAIAGTFGEARAAALLRARLAELGVLP